MSCQIVECSPADIDGLLEMMADFNRLEGIPWTPEACRPALARLLESLDLGVVCHILEGDARRGYGVVTWGFDLEWEGRDAFLTEIYLQTDARGRGLGSNALKLIEIMASRHGARALHLMVRPENALALRMYRKGGYESPPRVFLSKGLSAR
jgi:ribosomal protein S18 acetylase RimI-like enzyme